MATLRRAVAWTRRLVVRAPFESIVFGLAAIYVVLHLSPSSYALALDQLGADESRCSALRAPSERTNGP